MNGISFIIPIGIENDFNLKVLERLKNLYYCYLKNNTKQTEFIISECGSSKQNKTLIEQFCNENNINFTTLNNNKFSLSESRNNGVLAAKYSHICFLDVDLRFDNNFIDKIFNIFSIKNMANDKKSFFTIPVYYLTKEYSEILEKSADYNMLVNKIGYEHILNINDNIEIYSPISSVCIVNRFHYLSIGGTNPIYDGHGFEDFDLYYRLLSENNQIEKPSNYLIDKKTYQTVSYDGLRAMFYVLGNITRQLNSSLYTVHIWHERPKSSSFYKPNKNREIYKTIFTNFDKTHYHPYPISYKKTNILFFGIQNDNASNIIRDFTIHLGNIIYAKETDFFYEKFDNISFKKFIAQENISIVIFPNPYANHRRLEIYNFCKQEKIKFYCFERGALPDSWFLDPNGFNYDSNSYQIYLNKLNEEQINITKSYINNLLNTDNYLEKQNQKYGKEFLISKYGIKSKKVLFVPLQRPSDTVIQYFKGDIIESMEHFCNIIDNLANELKKRNWVVVVKKHPLEKEIYNFKNAIIVEDNTNIIDCLEVANSVALINSGVGIYAMLMKKPCFIFGNAFYELSNVNYKITNLSINNIINNICSINKIDEDKMLEFIYFLKFKFYSFAIAKTKEVRQNDGSNRTITYSLDFYELRINNDLVYSYERKNDKNIPRTSIVFEKFHLDFYNKSKTKQNNNVVNKPKNKSIKRLIKKFIKNPYLFCYDSKYKIVNSAKVLFKNTIWK